MPHVRFLDLTSNNPLTVPKSRKPKFVFTLRIIDLNNVPLVSGSAYVKWHLPTSAAAEHRGRTTKAPIREHKVLWDYQVSPTVRMVIDKASNLCGLEVHFEVMQEYHASGARADRIGLGVVKLNLAEYVEGVADDDAGEGPEPGAQGGSWELGRGGMITRRYLMQESKINSTIKIGIGMRQVDGDRNYVCPPLKSAAVFGGIAGIMSNADAAASASSQAIGAGAESDTSSPAGAPLSLASQKARDFGEVQDMYRRTLAASWASQMHELPADQCIEDIFAGGDGWGQHNSGDMPDGIPHASSNRAQMGSGNLSAMKHMGYSMNLDRRGGGKNTSPSIKTGFLSRSRNSSNQDLEDFRMQHESGRLGPGAGDGSQSHSSSEESQRRIRRQMAEVSEFDLREDLRSWSIGTGLNKLSRLGAPRQAGRVIDS